MSGTRVCCWRSALPPRSTSPDRFLGLRGLLGLEVDQHVGAAQPTVDRTLELMRDLVCPLQRRAVLELNVEVDVAAAPGAPRAELVKTDHLRGAMTLDGLAHGFELIRRQRLVDEHAARTRDDAQAGDDNRHRHQ